MYTYILYYGEVGVTSIKSGMHEQEVAAVRMARNFASHTTTSPPFNYDWTILMSWMVPYICCNDPSPPTHPLNTDTDRKNKALGDLLRGIRHPADHGLHATVQHPVIRPSFWSGRARLRVLWPGFIRGTGATAHTEHEAHCHREVSPPH